MAVKKLVEVTVEEIEAIIVLDGKAAVVPNPPSLIFISKNVLLIDPSAQTISPRCLIHFSE